MTAIALRRGDVITTRAFNTDEPYMLLGPCEHRAPGYFCDAHRVQLANVAQLVIHLQEDAPKLGTPCRVAVYCPRCRLYREADQAQLDALCAPLLETTNAR